MRNSLFIIILFILTACTEQIKQAEPINRIPHIYPDYIGVTIPAGIDDGQMFTVRGEGNRGLNGGPSGDLRVAVSLKPHPFFQRDGYNVWCEVDVSIVQATLGDELTVPTLDGQVKYSIPAGTQPGDVFKLKGKGIQVVNGTRRGDQLVKINVVIPKNITDKQKELLLEFNKDSGGKDVKPEEKGGLFGKKKKK